jgi:shikimate kinase
MSIRQIFQLQGEAAFRDLETAVLEDLCRGDRQVIATGGGVVLREQNRQQLSRGGRVVWLKASPATIYDRLAADPQTRQRRPDLTAWGGYEEIEALLNQRIPIYRQCADLEIDTENRTPAQIADEIVAQLRDDVREDAADERPND